jgi:hypothetical protein
LHHGFEFDEIVWIVVSKNGPNTNTNQSNGNNNAKKYEFRQSLVRIKNIVNHFDTDLLYLIIRLHDLAGLQE